MKGEVPLDPEFTIPLGKAELKREGKDVTVVTYGRMLERVLQAADQVREADGVSVEVVDLRTLIPLDKEAVLNSVKKTGRVLLVNDAHKTGGFIGEIAAMIAESDAFDYLDGRILRLAAEDVPVPYNAKLEAAMLPSVERIKKYILKLVNKR
jgi:pyruvate dehydrogenase E1 component beta subunit